MPNQNNTLPNASDITLDTQSNTKFYFLHIITEKLSYAQLIPR